MGARFFHPDLSATEVELTGPQAHHLLVSLRARPGQVVELFDGAGTLRQGTLLHARRKRCTLALGAHLPCPARPRPAIEVAVAPPKGTRQGWLVQKATELGVQRLLALDTARGSVPAGSVVARWQRVALEAAKQSGRVWLPEVVATTLRDLLSGVDGAPLLLLDPSGEPVQTLPAPRRVVLVVGPEGGFDDGERARLLEAGARLVCVAPHILRVETAVLAGVAQLLYAYGWGAGHGPL